MQVGLYFNQSRCIGCHTCTIACRDWHEHNLGAEPEDWIKVKAIEEGTYPNLYLAFLIRTCYHCEKPSCVKVCPTEAITKRAVDGVVVVDREDCMGGDSCALCRDACPYGVPQFGPKPDNKMQKCDLCVERTEAGRGPVCVEACPMRALDAGPLDELRSRYGDLRKAKGLDYCAEVNPSIVFTNRKSNDAAHFRS